MIYTEGKPTVSHYDSLNPREQGIVDGLSRACDNAEARLASYLTSINIPPEQGQEIIYLAGIWAEKIGKMEAANAVTKCFKELL